jgi:hypothetical protein
MPRRFGEVSQDPRVGTLTEEEEAKLREQEQRAVHEYRQERLKEAAKRAEKARDGVRELKDAAIKKELSALYKERGELDDERKAIKEQAMTNSARIAALEQEQADRRKAGWLAADLGSNQQPVTN